MKSWNLKSDQRKSGHLLGLIATRYDLKLMTTANNIISLRRGSVMENGEISGLEACDGGGPDGGLT